MFLAALDQTIVSTAMRTIADKLNGQTAQAWVTTAYLITSTISTPLYGKLSDTYGRKKFYLFAIGIFILGSMLCGTATGIYQLAAYRAVQGIGAGGLMSLAFAIVGDIVPPRERGRYQGYFMSVFGTSSVLGPVIGGSLAGQDHLLGIDGWRWIFYVNVPIGLAAFLVVSRQAAPAGAPLLRQDRLRRRRAAHHRGRAAAARRREGPRVGLGLRADAGHDRPRLVALVAFVPWERRMGEAAILPLRIFSSSVFNISSAVALLVGTAMFGALVVLPLYLQIVRGNSPTKAGLLLTPLMVGIIVASAFSGKVMSRTGKYKQAADHGHRGHVRRRAAVLHPRRGHARCGRRASTWPSWAPGSACRCRRWSSACRTRCRPATWASPPAR